MSPQRVSHSTRGAQSCSLPHTACPGGACSGCAASPSKVLQPPQWHPRLLLLAQDPGVTAGLLHRVTPIRACPDARPARGQHRAGVSPRSLQPPRTLGEPQPRTAGPHGAADAAGDRAALQEVASHNGLVLAGLVCDRVPTTAASPAAGPCSIPGAWGLRSLVSPPSSAAGSWAPGPSTGHAQPHGCPLACPIQAWRELGQPRAHLLSLPMAPEGARLPALSGELTAPTTGGTQAQGQRSGHGSHPIPKCQGLGRDCPMALPRCLAQPVAAPSQPTGTSMGGSWGCPWCSLAGLCQCPAGTGATCAPTAEAARGRAVPESLPAPQGLCWLHV